MAWTYDPITQDWPLLVPDTHSNGTRHYKSHAGERERVYPSVTTVLGATKPDDERAGIDEWRRRVGPKLADYISGQARDTGTSVHVHMERLLQNPNTLGLHSTGIPLLVKGHLQNLTSFAISRIAQVKATELVVYSDDLRIAGSCDALIMDSYRCEYAVVDWKCLSRGRNLRHDYLLQATLYAAMLSELVGYPIKKFYVVASIAENGSLLIQEGSAKDHIAEAVSRVYRYHDNPLNRTDVRMRFP